MCSSMCREFGLTGDCRSQASHVVLPYINGEARAALTALARHRGCSQREVIESLIVAEKNALVSAMDIDDLARFYEQVTQ